MLSCGFPLQCTDHHKRDIKKLHKCCTARRLCTGLVVWYSILATILLIQHNLPLILAAILLMQHSLLLILIAILLIQHSLPLILAAILLMQHSLLLILIAILLI